MFKVAVLMSTYNGERYLNCQIDSLLRQEGVDVEILARDDGSKDRTLEILESYKCKIRDCAKEQGEIQKTDAYIIRDTPREPDRVSIDNRQTGKGETYGIGSKKSGRCVKFDYYAGENVGPARSFLDLMKHAPEADFYALCDQDDTWLPDKLQISVQAIIDSGEQHGQTKDMIPTCNDTKSDRIKYNKPVLYYGNPRFSDNDGNLLKGPQGIYETSTDFPACLIKSNSTGCTMVFDRTLLDIINRKTPGPITMHDEWLHKVCLALGGSVIYDEDVHILYRQHGNNTIGGQLSMKKVMKRYVDTLLKPDCIRSRCIGSLLEAYGDEMPEDYIRMAAKVACYKDSLPARFRLFLDREIKTDYVKRNLMFKLAVLLGIF